MNTLRLLPPSDALAEAYLDMNEELRVADDPQCRVHLTADSFSEFVVDAKAQEDAENVPAPYVPMSLYWLCHPEGRILGEIRFRHWLNEDLEHEGGHIGYMIRPSERGKGYGTLMLKLMLELALEKGYKRILITCDTDNEASARVILANGGVFDSEGVSARSGNQISRYWIDL